MVTLIQTGVECLNKRVAGPRGRRGSARRGPASLKPAASTPTAPIGGGYTPRLTGAFV